ncbi:hypothetical protein CCR85_09195 [Rhodothalassium salexigens]|uniref:hypothetical protein n=1 Tax=Rhodothalassium salexigens TaxID=1086 RepID=UPI00191411DB|nr:hypothetical protein [Rhodothalassium salexigens]MBK5911660.1 hypothetical protein [Rhodothalassium salexigens]MBK5920953.1 hypothetical protein [Rhodothalassium salexigens]
MSGLVQLAIVLVLIIPPLWRVVSRAGFAGPWSLLFLIPVVNLIALWIFAFSDWPAERGRDGV